MTPFHAILLGIVQGLSEFLPISSSGHLILLPWVLHFEDPGLTFDVALHFGTLLALLLYFYKDWWILGQAWVRSLKKNPKNYSYDEKMIWYLILSTIPGVIGGLCLEEYAETIFRSPILIATQLALAGILLAVVDRYLPQLRKMKDMKLKDSLLIGTAQVLALVPGTSRSGITITMARGLKIDRVSAARFSFLLSTPITAGAVVLKLKDFHPDFNATLAIAMSALSGMLAIKYLLYFMQRYSYQIFAYYRVVIAVLIFVGVFVLGK